MKSLGIPTVPSKEVPKLRSYGTGIRVQQDSDTYMYMQSALTMAGNIMKPEPIDFSNIHSDKEYIVICFPSNSTLILHTAKYDYNLSKISYGSITTPPKMINKLDDIIQLGDGAIFFVVKDDVTMPLFYTSDCSAKMKLFEGFRHMQQIMDSYDDITYPYFVQAKGNKVKEILMQQYRAGNNESIIGLANEKFEPFMSITSAVDVKESYLPIVKKKAASITIEAGVPAFIKPSEVEIVEAKPPPPPPQVVEEVKHVAAEEVLAKAMEESKSLPSLQKTPAMMQADQIAKPMVVFTLSSLLFSKFNQANSLKYYLTRTESDIDRECVAILVKDDSYNTSVLYNKVEKYYKDHNLDITKVKIIKQSDIKNNIIEI